VGDNPLASAIGANFKSAQNLSDTHSSKWSVGRSTATRRTATPQWRQGPEESLAHAHSVSHYPSLMAAMYVQNSTPPVPVQVRSMTRSPPGCRSGSQRIVHAFARWTYLPEEIEERLQQYLRIVGTTMPRRDPQLSSIKEGTGHRSADFNDEVNQDPRYWRDNIEDTKVFTPNPTQEFSFHPRRENISMRQRSEKGLEKPEKPLW